jgi:murein DD-endopeptidase MepM/ murein hydrolase activator NlpD
MRPFDQHDFHPVVVLPDDYDVLDLGIPPQDRPARHSLFSVGGYNEVRPDTYESDLFEEGRNIHIGIDIGAPVGTAVHAFADGFIESFGYNAAQGDYGHTLVTGHRIGDTLLFALHGHLDAASTSGWRRGQEIVRGAVIGHLGAEHENGGWPSHVHFQLAWQRPDTHDMPGVVSRAELNQALLDHPDPRLVLGPLY